MSCCEGTSGGHKRIPGTGCCGSSCVKEKTGCSALEPRIRSCLCQENVGCLERADCGGFRPRGTAETGACPGPCQCAEEEAWNLNVPPKPNCEWLTNFSELRRQWSDHGRQDNCKCCNCKPCRTAAPCKPCLPVTRTCSVTSLQFNNCQECCDERPSGSACGQSVSISSPACSRQRDCSPTRMYNSSGTCPPPSCNRTNINSYQPCASSSHSQISNSCSTPCRPPSSYQPCSPSPRSILKKRTCCQCISGCCLCQPMPRTCNCPPPVQVDARADRDCLCECPSSPECACPPSERKFTRTKLKCPNARLCYPTPRLQPGPKCCCTKCQPCLPPPCDPCTSSKCRPAVSKLKLCNPDSQCRPTTHNNINNSRNGSRQIRTFNRSPDSRCRTSSAAYRTSGQSRTLLNCPDNDEKKEFSQSYGDNSGEAGPENRDVQCHCGPLGSRGCADDCDYCCSVNCAAPDTNNRAVNAAGDDFEKSQCGCGSNANTCAKSCDYCCSQNCNSTPPDSPSTESSEQSKRYERIGAGEDIRTISNDGCSQNLIALSQHVASKESSIDCVRVSPVEVKSSTHEFNVSSSKTLNESTFEIGTPQSPIATYVPAVAGKPATTCKLFRSLIRAKSPVKYTNI